MFVVCFVVVWDGEAWVVSYLLHPLQCSGVVCFTGFVATAAGENPHLVLPGHRSIVNQTRYSKVHQVLASSGVEKVVKVSKCVVSPSMDLPSMLPMACSCGVPLL